MAVSSVLAPNGKTYTFEHPDGASQEDLFKFVHQSSQVKPKAQATKPGVVENVARSIPAGAAAAGYDVLGAIGTMALEGLGKYAKAGSDPKYAEKMDQAIRGAQETVSEYTFDIGATANESFGVDQGRFSADVGGGLGQLPVMVLTGGLASVPMSFAEVIKDAEQSLDVKYYDMTEDQKAKVAATGGAYAAFSLAADRIGLKYMGLTKLNKFFDGSETVKGSIVKDVLKGTLGEGLTETSQAVVKDQLARVYDDDREYNIDSVKGYLYEGAVGATVGGIASTGTSVVKNIGSETSVTKKSDLKKPVEDRPALEVPRTVQIEYKELDGQVRVFPLAVTEGQDPMAAAEEALAGRYDPAFGLTVTEQSQPVGPEQKLDLPDQAPDPTQEEVLVQPEAAVEPEVAEQVLPEVVPQVVPTPEQAPEQAPAVRGNFRISPRMAKSKPRYRGQTVAYGSELELAVYMATAKGKNASKVRSELIEAGYSPAEINALGSEVRSQMKKGYNPNSKKPISVAIAQDVTAEASGVDRLSMSFKDVTKRTPEIQEQAKILRENIKAGDREQSRAVAQAADEFKPVHAYDFVPAPETNSEIRIALNEKQLSKMNASVSDGKQVAMRLDIPAYRDYGTWVPAIHEPKGNSFQAGDPLSYQSTAVLDNVQLGVAGKGIAALNIATGKSKSTIATIKGTYKKVTPTQAKKMADKALKDPSYVQVGMDPERRGYFYNRETMQEVVAGDQAIQVGPLVLVKNPQYGATPSNEWLSLGPDVVAEAAPSVTPSVSSVSNTQDPSRVGTARNPDGETSQDSNIDVSMVPEETLEKHMEIMDYGHLPEDIKNEKDTKVKYEKLVNFMKDNLLSLYKAFPDELRARATQWYDGANKIANGFAKRYQITTEQASAVLAVLSPQKDWFMNVAQGEQVIHIWRNYQDVKIEGIEYDGMIEEIIDSAVAPVKQKKKKLVNETAEQTKRRQNYNKKLDKKAKDDRRFVLEQIKGKTVRELAQDPSKEGQALMAWAIRTNAQVQFGRNYSIVTPEGDFGGPSLRLDGQPANNGWGSTSEIVKAVSIIEDGSAQNISDRLGSEHKVRNFYNNIAAPNSPYGDATMDTHAVAAALLMPLGSSAQQVSDNFGSGKAGKTTKGGQTVSGTYYVYLDAYRRAAKEVGLQPRQMQSITWEAIRQVYLPQDRKPELVKQRTKEWNTYKDETEARQQIIGETINAPEWSGTSPSRRSGTSAAGVQGNGNGSILGGDLLFRGGSDIIGVPGNSTQITVPAGNRLRLYSGTVSYRSGSSKNTGRSEKTFAGISRVNAKDFVEIASRNKRNHKFGSSVDVYKAKDYKGYHLIVAKGKGKAYVTLAISPSGEVSSVTASKSATKADLAAAFDLAIASGAVRWLNGFDTVLGDIYSYFGFKPVARLPFDPEQSPSDWSYKKYQAFNDGQPDLLFMKFDGQMGNKLSDYPDPEYASSYDQALELATEGNDVTAKAADTAVEDRGPRDTYDNGGQVQDAIEQEFDPIGKKINVKIVMRMKTDYVARYNATQGIIEYNPMLLLKRSKAGIRAAMREEIIHAAMHKVIMVSARKKFSMAEGGKGWTDFFGEFGKSLTDAERADIKDVYQNIKPDDYVGYGSEYSRAVIQNLLYGEFSEEYQMQSQGGPAWNTIVKLLRSVQAYMAKVLGPMIKTNPEAAQVIVDSVELLKAVDPSIRPKSQDVVAQAYDATDKNTAKENTEAGERVSKDSSERIREERKWFDGAFRKTASKYLTPVITRLNRIHPMFGRILQNLDSAIRMRSMGYRKQTEMFFNKLNAVKGAEFQELKQLIFFSPTPEEANLPSNKAKMQRRDALLHKHGLLNMYRLDVQPILEEIYAEYTALGMPKIGYLEDYFPRVIKDLEGLIKSYGHKTKRTFELLVNEENIRRSELKDKDGNPAPLPEMQESELGRFFQDFLQGKFRLDLNGVKLPGNVKAREIQLIPEDKLKFYDEPGVAFGKYTTNMARAIESFKVVGDTKKGEGRLLGELGKLSQELFAAGQIDQADASELKTLTELITSQFQAENQILKSLGTLTYMATLINPGPVLVQIMDLYKVALYRGLGGVVSGTYRTVTGNRRFDIERDFGIAKTQLSAEFEDPSFLTKALDFGLSRLVPFRQMDTAMKHASIEAAYDDFVKKAKAPVGSKKHQQLIDYLTIKMGPEGARKAIDDLKLDRAAESTEIKEALLSELLERQPLTYLQVPEGYQTDPSKRLFYKLSTFMLLDLNYNRQEFMNDLGGPGKTLKQRTVALRRLAYMATLLTMFGLPSDLLDDWIAGKDTYIPEHVMNNMLGMFGLSRYTTSRALNKGAVESVIQRFTPPAINIMIDGEQSLRSWVKGDKELFDIKSWRNSPLSDVWYYRTGGGVESQRKYQTKQRKEGITPTFDR